MLAFRRGLRLYLGKRRLAMPLNWMPNQTRADFMPCDKEYLTSQTDIFLPFLRYIIKEEQIN